MAESSQVPFTPEDQRIDADLRLMVERLVASTTKFFPTGTLRWPTLQEIAEAFPALVEIVRRQQWEIVQLRERIRQLESHAATPE